MNFIFKCDEALRRRTIYNLYVIRRGKDAFIWRRGGPRNRFYMDMVSSQYDMLPYLDKSIQRLAALRGRIEAAEQAVKDAKAAMISEAERMIRNAPTRKDQLEFASRVYWIFTEVPGDKVLDLIGFKRKQVKTDLPRPSVNTRCHYCNKPMNVLPTSRTDLKAILKGNHYIACPACKEQQAIARKDLDQRIKQQHSEAAAKIHALKTMRYSEYLKTDHWQSLRKQMLKRANFKCQLCNKNDQLNVHHRTYERRGHEDLKDLIVLCADCHGKFHDKLEGAS